MCSRSQNSLMAPLDKLVPLSVMILCGKPNRKNHLFDELNRGGCITLTNRLCFHPLCKFINRHQEVGLLILGPFERPNHIQPPSCKWPSDWNHPQFLSRHMSAS